MELQGRVQNGVVVFDGQPSLPEGAVVTVVFHVRGGAPSPGVTKRRVEVPLVRTGQPGSVRLTGEQVARILDEEDAAPRH